MEIITKKYNNKTFFSWLISYFIIFCIPIVLSIILQFNSNNIIENKIRDVETEAVGQMKYICDGAVKTTQQILNLVRDNDGVRSFAGEESVEDTESKLMMKKIFEDIQESAANDNNITGIYVFSYSNDYMISSNHGVSNLDNGIFSYEEVFGISKMAFWEEIDKAQSSSILLLDDKGDAIFANFNVIVTNDVRNPAGIVLATYEIGESVFNTDSETKISGILKNDGKYVGIKDDERINSDEVLELEKIDEYGAVRINGKEYLVAMKKSDVQNWVYVYGVRSDILFIDLAKSRTLYLVYMAISILVCIMTAVLLARKNYNPVLQLAQKIQKQRLDDSINQDYIFRYIEQSYTNLEKERNNLENQIEIEKNVLINNVFNRIIKGYYKNEEEIENALEQYNISFANGKVLMIVWAVDDYSNIFSEDSSSLEADTIDLVKFMIRNISGEYYIKCKCPVYAIECDNMTCFVFDIANDTENSECIEKLISLSNEANKVFEEKFNLALSYFISAIHENIRSIGECYMDCLTGMSKTDDVISEVKSNDASNYEKIAKFGMNIGKGNYSNAAKQYIEIVNGLEAKDLVNNEIKLNMIGLIKEMHYEIKKNTSLDRLAYNDLIGYLLNINDVKILKKETVKAILSLDSFSEDTIESSLNRSKQILNYVESNIYNADLSIGMIASHFELSDNYVSKIMKQELGISLTKYINGKRVDNIKYMMDNTKENISEISMKSGFYSYRTMVRIFKQFEGVTPSEYRKKR